MSKSILLICSLALGCAHVDTGLKVAEKGVALVDMGVAKAAAEYTALVTELRAHCAEQSEVAACEDALHVSDAQVDAVCAFGEDPSQGCIAGAAKDMSAGYAKTVEGLSDMSAAWQVLYGELKLLKEYKKRLPAAAE